MKKTVILTLILCCVNISLALAAEQIDISLQQWRVKGSFNYYLHNQGTPQLLSLVSMPQNQPMGILKIKYSPDAKKFIAFQFGSTTSGAKGRGSDSDWQNIGSGARTDYGTMDINGDQTMIAVDFGTIISKRNRNKTSVFWGWDRRDTRNQISNVVYHMIGGVNVGNLTQANNGSYLNGTFSGIHIGAENEYKLNEKLSFSSSFRTSYLNAKTHGHWANHFPPWDWENSGKTWGYDVNFGLIYKFHKNMTAELGFYSSYAKMTNGKESLNYNNGVSADYSGIDLSYKQKGYYLGLHCKL